MAETLFHGQTYEPPRIDTILAPEDLEREILYASGTATPSF